MYVQLELLRPKPLYLKTTPNAAMVVEGKLGDHCTWMLIDTGSAVTLVRKDVGREAAEVPVDHLTHPARPTVAANGEMLDFLGQGKLQLQVVDLHVQFPVFVARELTQECLLGADFLKQHNCVINMREQTLMAGGKQVMCQSQDFPELMSVCHVSFLQIL